MISAHKPRLSVLFSFYNAADTVESVIDPFFNITNIPLELIIVNDGSTDNTSEVIESVLDYYNHKHAYFFDYEKHRGRGISLNEACHQCTTSLFVIIEGSCEVIEEELLHIVDELENSNAPAAVMLDDISNSPDALAEILKSGSVPASSFFVFNQEAIQPEKLVLNPFISAGHAFELFCRFGAGVHVLKVSSAFPTVINKWIGVSQNDMEIILFHAGFNLDMQKTEPEKDSESGWNTDKINKTWERVKVLRSDGHYAESLDLVNEILINDPEHSEAEDTKIFLLERLNRYVEASELKFLRKRRKVHAPVSDSVKKEDILISRPAGEPIEEKKPEKESALISGPVHQERDRFITTIIIPVTGVALPFIEPCLVSVSHFCSPEDTELIIVDNACLDDTYSYLDQLRENNFFNIRIIKNLRNAGFARSANQGIEKARGEYICLMHSDVVLESDAPNQLAVILRENEHIGLIGPLTDNTMNPEQALLPGDNPKSFTEASYLDSFMMVFRQKDELRFDTDYKQAWFEDVDLCWQLREYGREICIADGVSVKHYLGASTDAMGLGYDSVSYQDNLNHFNEKWKTPTPKINAEENPDQIEELIMWGHTVNIFHPHADVVARAKELLTAEVRTTILNTDFDQHELTGLIRLMMVLDQRDVLRQLEEKLTPPFDSALLSELIYFYFNLNVYSRCQKYLELNQGNETLTNRMYRLRIAWSEKKLDLVNELVDELMNVSPGHPEVYKIAGDLNKLNGNKKEAEEFYTLADQLDPFRFPWPMIPKSESRGLHQGE